MADITVNIPDVISELKRRGYFPHVPAPHVPAPHVPAPEPIIHIPADHSVPLPDIHIPAPHEPTDIPGLHEPVIPWIHEPPLHIPAAHVPYEEPVSPYAKYFRFLPYVALFARERWIIDLTRVL